MANPPKTSSPTPSAPAPSPSASSSTPTAGASAPKPLIPASHVPTPSQQNPDVRRPLAPYLPTPDPDGPVDPVKALNARQKAAIESRMAGAGRAEVAAGGVDGAPTPPKPASVSAKPSATPAPSAKSAAASVPPSPSSTPATPTSKPSEPSDGKAPSTSEPASTATVLSFTPKEFKKWAQANPEEALAFREAIDKDTFRMGEEPKTEWIRMTQKGRKLKETLRSEREETLRIATEKETRAQQHLELAEKTAGKLRYLTEMWEACNGKDAQGNRVIDWDTLEEAVRQNTGGLGWDDLSRMRARRGVSNPEAARLKAELRRQELELERLRPQTNGAAAEPSTRLPNTPTGTTDPRPAEPPPAPAPAPGNGLHPNPEEFWGDEVPSDHPLRQFAGWGKLVDHAMLQFHDDVLDEYSRDAEDIANELLEKKLAALGTKTAAVTVPAHTRAKPKTPKNRGQKLEDPDAPATNVPGVGIPASKLVPRGKVNTDRSHRPARPEDLMTDGGLMARQNWAIERAKLRARGIDPDTMEASGDD
jgi:hypothetical protein